MAGKLSDLAIISMLCCFLVSAVAQDSADDGPTLEERIALLETRLASLDSRFELRGALDDTTGERMTMTTRVVELERAVDRLIADVQRVERQADAALREAMQARRDATTAQQLARDAANRLR